MYKLLDHNNAQKCNSFRFFFVTLFVTSLLLVYFLFAEEFETTIFPFKSFLLTGIKKSRTSPEVKFVEISTGNFAFSAVIDQRNADDEEPKQAESELESIRRSQIRVMMAVKKPSTFSCQFADGSKIPGKMLEIGSGVGYLNCLAPKSVSLEIIDEITICDDTLQKSAIVPISYRIPKNTISFDQTFAICVPLIFGEKYTAKHFVEFVEMNRLLGVEQISIYTNGSLNSKLKVVMEKYSNQGFLEVISFLRPFNDDKVYYYGQHFTIADCLLRHVGRTEFVALHDLDEFAVVKVDGNSSFSSPPNRLTFLPELFSNDKTAAIQLKIDYIVENKSKLLFTLNDHEQIYYEGKTQYYSSKCIVRPHYFLTQNVHYPIDHARKDYRTDLVDENRMTIFHYRDRKTAIDRARSDIGGKENMTAKTTENNYFSKYFSDISRIFDEKCVEFEL